MFEQLLRRFRPAARQPQPAAPAPPPEGEPVYGCGWFDSSHELIQGIHVIEVNDASTPLWRLACVAQA